jgi:multidrug efflux pump subunit AcrB
VIVNIEADVIPSVFPSELQSKIDKYAREYQYPEGISFVPKGENSGENAELIQATLISFIVAVCLIFVILVLQFNSFAQPAIILYVIVLALI